ncbi:MAG: hypothetical protein U5O16_01725, partial [Rhodococcus sp. (in: high G+C Gram-positive bacteria)]|uniref:hypothetical protein n=1 Tax=Rhodococcus sp. TaxID=1831 RepID=UPI002AD93713|nr:hypothetical protein [Rhodococcus sp. (in: high G+C Gram-positive bacteria)]
VTYCSLGLPPPLRCHTDLVNQWQTAACARYGKTAALAAPFKPKDAELFAIISNRRHLQRLQRLPGRHGTLLMLRYVQQLGITELVASVFKEGVVRADDIPLVLPVMGAQGFRPAMPRCACSWARWT